MKNWTETVIVTYWVLIPFRNRSGNNFAFYHSDISQLLLPPKEKKINICDRVLFLDYMTKCYKKDQIKILTTAFCNNGGKSVKDYPITKSWFNILPFNCHTKMFAMQISNYIYTLIIYFHTCNAALIKSIYRKTLKIKGYCLISNLG